MNPQQQSHNASQEGRIVLAIQAYKNRQFRSLRRAADVYNIPRTTLTNRYNGTLFQANYHPIGRKLTATKEQMIVRHILDLDSRGFAPRLCEVVDMADKILAARGGGYVGKQ